MKKIITFILTLVMVCGLFTFNVEANKDIEVYVDGNKILFDVPPIIQNNRTLVPMRYIFEALGTEVTWNDETKTAKAVKNSMTVEISVGSNQMTVNNQSIALDSPAILINNRTLVPVRAVSEAFHADVNWDSVHRTVLINTNYGIYLGTAIPTYGAIIGDPFIRRDVDASGNVIYVYKKSTEHNIEVVEYMAYLETIGYRLGESSTPKGVSVYTYNYDYKDLKSHIYIEADSRLGEVRIIPSVYGTSDVPVATALYYGTTVPDYGVFTGSTQIGSDKTLDGHQRYVYSNEVVNNQSGPEYYISYIMENGWMKVKGTHFGINAEFAYVHWITKDAVIIDTSENTVNIITIKNVV